MKTFIHYKASLLLLVLTGFVLSCTQHSDRFVNRTFHNLTARDNAFFHARENMKYAELQVAKDYKDDYDKVLDIVYQYDTLRTKGITELPLVQRFASLPPTRHANSNYVDKSYVLIGRVLMYQGNFKDGMQTFKYVNTKGKDVDARHDALVQLMRGYVRMNDYKSANVVNQYIIKEINELNTKNLAEYYLTMAQYHKELEEYEKCRLFLEEVLPLVKKKYTKARIYYVLGQIYQMKQQDSLAFKNYRMVLKKNPPYEMDFYTRLSLARVSDVNKDGDVRRIEKYLTKMLKDPKNDEYRDRIYYELGTFEHKQKDYPEALAYLQKSIQVSKGNNIQKGRTYLKSGKIYYEDLENYEYAKLYYDSAVNVWNKEDKEYKEISDRHKILEEFVKHYLTVKREDSLQRLAKMDSATLSKHIDKLIAAEKERIKQERIAREKAEKEKEKQAQMAASPNPNTDLGQGSIWYFYNSALYDRGKVEFARVWGKRVLEDDWRRSTKEKILTDETGTDSLSAQNQNNVNKDSIEKSQEIVIDKGEYYKDIPFTPEQLAESDKKIMEALFNLAKVYDHKLNEDIKAIATYEELLKRFPEYKTSEVLYSLYLLCRSTKDKNKGEFYKNKLLTEYPHSVHAKLILNPNYLAENKESNKHAAEIYESAYSYYLQNDYNHADSVIQHIRKTYPDNNLEDKMTMLEILMAGKKREYELYRAKLEKFIKDYADSPLQPKAKSMLEAYEKSRSASVTPNISAPVPAPTPPAPEPAPMPAPTPSQEPPFKDVDD